MNKNIFTVVLLVFITCLGGGGAAAQANDTSVMAALDKYDKAWNGKDQKTVDKILAPDYIYFSSTGGTTSRRRTLEFLVSPDYKLTFVERSEIKNFLTGDTAIVSSRWKGKGTYGKEEINDDQRCSLVFSKIKGSWKLASEHCTQIAAK